MKGVQNSINSNWRQLAGFHVGGAEFNLFKSVKKSWKKNLCKGEIWNIPREYVLGGVKWHDS